ncbi:MAG: leader peptidase (prepilin peptidase) / N-methyltransferase [Patescibacteria group bacterium]|nr:leader peptidase (prepilin peptidase) / N-methyltransferase [Patescibacteria group bacterium]
MLTVLSFIYGLSLGSFANLVADRLRVKTIFSGRSKCLHCGHNLTWKELIPIFSFLYQKGKCKKCKTKLTSTYIWSELATGFLIALLPYIISTNLNISDNPQLIYYGIFLYILFSTSIALSMIITIYDLRHMLVPFGVVIILFLLGILSTIIRQFVYDFNIFDSLSGIIVALPYAFLYFISKGKWVGIGDVFMYTALGFIIGLPMGISMFFYSIWIGALVALSLMIIHKNEYNLKSEIPFTPFIILGFILSLYTNADILNLLINN